MHKKIVMARYLIVILCISIFLAPTNTFGFSQVASKTDVNQALQAYSDEYFNKVIGNNQIPGATLVIVKEGKIIFKKGYGYADVEKKIPVDPDKTIFRAGSVSKLFTGTAVMQLKERNKLDLNADINGYLKDLKIRNKFNKTITLANLMTHTAGFDEGSYTGGPGYDADMNQRFVDSVTKYVPKVVRMPSVVPSYSNYGATLEGYIVSLVSGDSFTAYMDQNIFQPLNMKNSTFNMGNSTIANMASGYYQSNGKYNKIEIYGEQDLPAGGLNTTASDMGNFILAHLQNGRFENYQLLKPATLEEMHAQHFKSGQFVGGICYAFMEDYVNGHRVIEHNGSVPGFTSQLSIIPESHTGYFLSINEDTNVNDVSSVLRDYQKGLVKILLPSPPNKTFKPDPISRNELEQYVGIYKGTRTPHTTLYKIGELTGDAFELEVKVRNNKLLITNGGVELSFVPVAPNEFKNEKDNSFISFLPDATKRAHYMMVSRINSMEKIKWYEQSKIHIMLLAVFLITFIIQAAIGVWRVIRALKEKTQQEKSNTLALTMSALNLAFVTGLVTYYLTLPPSFLMIEFGTARIANSIFVKLWLLLPFVSAGLVFVWIWQLFKSLHQFKRLQKGWYIFFTLVASGFILFLNYWCLFGYKFY